MKKFLSILILLTFSLITHAESANSALTAAVADTASTAAALSSGLVELNPLGAVGAVVSKVIAMGYIGQLPEEERAHPYGLVSSFWGGASANNLCWLTGAGPVCVLVGLATGRYLWNNGTAERDHWAQCKALRVANPEAPCSRQEGLPKPHEEATLAQAE